MSWYIIYIDLTVTNLVFVNESSPPWLRGGRRIFPGPATPEISCSPGNRVASIRKRQGKIRSVFSFLKFNMRDDYVARMGNFQFKLTHTETETGSYHNTTRSTFWYKYRTEKQCCQFVTTNVNKCIVYFELLLSIALTEMAHVVREYCVVIGDFVILTEAHYNW